MDTITSMITTTSAAAAITTSMRMTMSAAAAITMNMSTNVIVATIMTMAITMKERSGKSRCFCWAPLCC